MANATHSDTKEVIFVCPSSQLKIRMMNHSVHAIADAVQALKATHFVTVDGWSVVDDAPIWAVFSARALQKDTPTRGEWTLGAAVKTFTGDVQDAAVMYAVMMGGRL